MSDDLDNDPVEAAENEGLPLAVAAASPARARKTVASKISAPEPETKEPRQESVAPAAKAEPAAATPTPYAAVSGKGADPIAYSAAVPADRNGPRRSLTVYHVQRRLYELGYRDGYSETPYGKLTRHSVSQWQNSRGEEPTGVLTRAQFTDLFDGDYNVSTTLDLATDHQIS